LHIDGIKAKQKGRLGNIFACRGRIFGSKRDEVTGGWRQMHNEELHDLKSSPNISRMITSKRIGWTGHVARMGGKDEYIQGFYLKNGTKETDTKT
jgi:hypothetical protein